MTSTDTLLPCPFCGTDELSHGWAAPGFRGGVSDGHVECMECGVLVIAATEQDAIAAWNRRTPPTPATDEREAVDAAFHKSWCAVIDLLDRDYITPAKLREAIVPFVAAEILAAEEREAVAQWCSGCHEVRSVDCYRADCPKSDTERRAAEILAAEARGAERERARKGTVTTYKRGFGPGDGDSAIEHGAGK